MKLLNGSGHLYIALTLLLTVYGQLVLKWQITAAGALPAGNVEKLAFLVQQILRPWVFSAFLAAFLASLAWMAAMTKFDLSFAYLFMSLNFALVIVAGALLFDEPLTPHKLGGLGLIVAGILVASRS